jgi:uncharacterized membrane protein
LEIAPSQPWSVGGTLAVMLTGPPDPPAAADPPASWLVSAAVSAVVSSSPPPQAATPIEIRAMVPTTAMSRLSDIVTPPCCDFSLFEIEVGCI